MASIYVPEDVVIDILSRLRVKSLFRFKCVCKPWCALIDNSSFIAKHSHRSNLNEDNGCLLLEVYPSIDDNVEGGFFLFSEETLEVLEKVYLPQDFNFGPRVLMVASCGGIVCLHNCGQKEVTLWNPATGELKVLHGSAIPLYNERECDYHVGFGFDAKRNDYKVIRIVSFSLEYNRPQPQVEVYSLSRDTWRVINTIPPTITSDTSVCLNGIAYWTCHENYEKYLLSFDMSSELFNLTPLPLEDTGILTVVNGSVAVASYGRYGSDSERKHYYETWVLKIASCDGQGERWEVQEVGPIFNVVHFPLRHTKNPGLIFRSPGGQLFFYDLITLQRKYLEIKASHRRYRGAGFIDYKESLYRFHSDYSVERPTKMTKRK